MVVSREPRLTALGMPRHGLNDFRRDFPITRFQIPGQVGNRRRFYNYNVSEEQMCNLE
jgi:hypothetical protein